MKSCTRVLLMLVACLLSMVYPTTHVYGAESVKIGVLAFRPKPQTLEQWQPLTVVLKQAIPERDFVVEALTYPELDQAIAARQLDFVLTNSGHYVLLKKRNGLSSPLATLAVKENGHPTTVFGGVIFTRADQANLNTLRDIKGKAVAVVSTESLGGYQMQANELSRAGFHMPQDIKMVVTGMPHDKAVEAVLTGHAEVGFARSGVLEGMIHEGKLDLKQLKILNPQTHPDFPQQVSTPLYPEWPFAATPGVDENLVRHVAAALFLLGDNETSTKAMGIHGFVVPADYSPVEEVLRELHLAPFDVMPHFTIHDIWSHYRWQLIGGGLASGMILFLGVNLLFVNRKLVAKGLLLEQQQNKLQESEEMFRTVADYTLGWEYWQGPENEMFYISPSCEVITGYSPAEFIADPDLLIRVVHPDDRHKTNTHRHDISNQENGVLDFRIVRRDGAIRWIEHICHPVWTNDGLFKGRRVSNRDITERKQAEGELKRLEWMLTDRPVFSRADQQPYPVDQGYGDLTLLNRHGIIRTSIDNTMLLEMMQEYQNVLETSGAIYETNGDYATGIFSSRWCRLLDRASRQLCHTEDNVAALNSGQWLCHESCWTCCAKESIAQGVPVDIECNGGIRLYAVPIFAGNEVIGSINFGHGEPPRDPARLKEIADLYQVDYEELCQEANAYDPRPPYIIAMAKKRLQSTARLIGELVGRKRAEAELRKLNEDLEERVRERTASLEKKSADLENANKAFVGRELRMIELKEKIVELEKKNGA